MPTWREDALKGAGLGALIFLGVARRLTGYDLGHSERKLGHQSAHHISRGPPRFDPSPLFFDT
jgi:hypothetical protein